MIVCKPLPVSYEKRLKCAVALPEHLIRDFMDEAHRTVGFIMCLFVCHGRSLAGFNCYSATSDDALLPCYTENTVCSCGEG